MTSSQTKLQAIKDALTSISGLSVYHYWRFGVDAPYCIWEEDGETSLEANNHKAEQGFTGAVHYFTLTEYDGNFDAIQTALNNIENLSWRYDGADYEEDTNLIHHSWRWTLL